MTSSASTDVRTIAFPSGDVAPVLGQGTWRMAQDRHRRADELLALQTGLDLGLTLIDTAEVYSDGASEELVSEAIAGRRDEVFLVSKVAPRNATREGTVAACEGSLRRLRTDRLDLYLLHWPGPAPLEDTVEAFRQLVDDGKIRSWGVSNFDTSLLEELVGIPCGDAVASNQMEFSLSRREIERDVLPWCREREVPVMAYSPIGEGKLIGHSALERVAEEHGATAAQIALAWVLRHDGVMTIPKAGTREHVEENRAALELELTERDLATLDDAFPA